MALSNIKVNDSSVRIDEGPFNISLYNAVDPNDPSTYSSLTDALSALPIYAQQGGMSVKYVDTSFGEYQEYRLNSSTYNTTVSNWQCINADDIFDITAATGNTYNTFIDALGTNASNIPVGVRKPGISIKFALTIYSVTSSVEAPSGVTPILLSSEPTITSGNHEAGELASFSTLPSQTGDSTYYSWKDAQQNFTYYTVTKLSPSYSSYAQHRYMLSDTTDEKMKVAKNWQGVDAYPVKDSKNFVLSDGIKYDETLALANNSFYQVREVDIFERIKWISAFTDVKIAYTGTPPTGYPNIKVALSLVRRNSTSSHEIRFKIKIGDNAWTQTYRYVDSIVENEKGVTPYYVKGSSIIVSCNIDWSIFNIGFSPCAESLG